MFDRRHEALAIAALAAAACRSPNRAEEPLRVAAASDLTTAFAEVAPAYEKATGKRVVVTYGSTGLLAKQLTEGAPFHVFAGANVAFVDDAVRSGACDGATKALYARGALAIWAKDAAALPKDLAALADARFTKIAIATPEHAPYGRAAKEALEAAGVWPAVAKRMVFGENVQQALVFASSGNADAAIVAMPLARSAGGATLAVPPSMHAPLDQAVVVCNGGGKGARDADARAFVSFVTSDAGRAILARHGFAPPP